MICISFILSYVCSNSTYVVRFYFSQFVIAFNWSFSNYIGVVEVKLKEEYIKTICNFNLFLKKTYLL